MNQSVFGRLAGIAPSSVAAAVKRGVIDFAPGGKSIDIDAPKTRAYLAIRAQAKATGHDGRGGRPVYGGAAKLSRGDPTLVAPIEDEGLEGVPEPDGKEPQPAPEPPEYRPPPPPPPPLPYRPAMPARDRQEEDAVDAADLATQGKELDNRLKMIKVSTAKLNYLEQVRKLIPYEIVSRMVGQVAAQLNENFRDFDARCGDSLYEMAEAGRPRTEFCAALGLEIDRAMKSVVEGTRRGLELLRDQ